MKTYHLFMSPVGILGLLWEREERPVLIRIFLPEQGRKMEEIIRETCPLAAFHPPEADQQDHLVKLGAYIWKRKGEAPLGFTRLEASEFEGFVLSQTSQIPPGRVSSYGALARRLGKPGAARAVGNALAANPLPLLIPCHRVVRADGRLGGFGGGREMKKSLLAKEGVILDSQGKAPREYFY